ncbi:MAG: hypothetical protein ACK5MN_04625 [Lachnospiraceae bacterium]
MIDYDEELKKFEPSLDVSNTEDVIYDREFTDLLDLLKEIIEETKTGRQPL